MIKLEEISFSKAKQLVKDGLAEFRSQYNRYPYLENSFLIYKDNLYFKVSNERFKLIVINYGKTDEQKIFE